jgi:hypothetical protein
VLEDPYRLALWMNMVGFGSALLAIPIVWSFAKRVLASATAATAAVIVFFFSPVTLVLATSGHPVLPAFVLMMGAGLVLVVASAEKIRWAGLAAGGLLAFASLCVRADMALGLPMLVWASQQAPKQAWEWRREMRPLLIRLAVLALAALAFLGAQSWSMSGYPAAVGAAPVPKGLDSLIRFIITFYDISRIPKGLIMAALGCGLAAVVVGLLALLPWRNARLDSFRWGLLLLTVLPSLCFWLPNPQPARHFLLVAFGVALLIGWFIADIARVAWTAALAAVGVSLASQLAAEAAYPKIVSRYEWSYPSLTARRTTNQVPLGAFWKDGPVKVALNENFRAEAEALARETKKMPRLIVFGDEIYYMAAYLCATDKQLTARASNSDRIPLLVLESPHRTIVLVEKQPAWPKDVAKEVLADERFASWPYFIQPATRSRYDLAPLPPNEIKLEAN